METEDVASSGALRDLTNTNGKQSLPSNIGIKKLKRALFVGERVYDENESEGFHSVKAHNACKQVKGNPSHLWKANPCNLKSSEADESPTKSNELKETHGVDGGEILGHPVHSVKEHDEPMFSNQSGLAHLNKEKGDVGESSAYEKLLAVNLCHNCSCSSCMKAAHMWMDLMYQDTRGRLNALKNSRKRARTLGAKVLGDDKAGDTSQIIAKEAVSIESDLRLHWRSLITRTKDSLQCEVMQTQSLLTEIQQQKEKYKSDLEEVCPEAKE